MFLQTLVLLELQTIYSVFTFIVFTRIKDEFQILLKNKSIHLVENRQNNPNLILVDYFLQQVGPEDKPRESNPRRP